MNGRVSNHQATAGISDLRNQGATVWRAGIRLAIAGQRFAALGSARRVLRQHPCHQLAHAAGALLGGALAVAQGLLGAAAPDQFAVSGVIQVDLQRADLVVRSAEHTSELQYLMRISYAVLCLKKKISTI